MKALCDRCGRKIKIEEPRPHGEPESDARMDIDISREGGEYDRDFYGSSKDLKPKGQTTRRICWKCELDLYDFFDYEKESEKTAQEIIDEVETE